MVADTPIKIQIVKSLSNLKPSRMIAVKADNESSFSLYVTDKNGVPYPLKDLQGSGGITGLTNTDGNLVITGANSKVINIAPALLSVINSALQSGANISELVNDEGFITLADIPTNISEFINDAGYLTAFTETDPIFQASEASNFVAGDKTNLDNQSGVNSGDETTSTIQTKRPLKTINGDSLEGTGNLQIEYNDLDNIPTTFTPSTHTHVEADITDLDKYTQAQTDANFIKIIPKFVFVRNINDFPTAVSNIITLENDTTYFISTTIDLNGSRLVGGANTTLMGASSEVSILTSTGLGIGIPLLTSIYTTPITHLSINNVDTAFNFDGTTNPNDMALDFTGVNFVNVTNVGLVKEASNFIFDKGAFLGSKGLKFDGTIGTVALNNSLFSGDGLAGNILEVLATCTITRRFRTIYSSIIAFGSTVGINVNTLATIPNQSYILDTINFSGGGTYLSGLDNTSNKSLFNNCVGIINTASRGFMFMVNNGTDTTIGVPNVNIWVKANGTTTAGTTNSQFSHSSNRLTYTGTLSKSFHIVVCANVRSSGTNQTISIGISVNGTIITDSEMTIRTSNANQEFPGATQFSLNLNANDYIELFVKNTSSTNIRVSDFNMNITNISS